MMKRLIIVAIATATLAGCANTSTLSGDVYSANQAKQVQQVTYGTMSPWSRYRFKPVARRT